MQKKNQLCLIFQAKKITNYEIFNLVFGDFKDKFEENDLIFTQTYIVEHQYVFIYALKDKQKVDAAACLDFLNGLQEKFTSFPDG